MAEWTKFAPGDLVKQTGIYRVQHAARHRAPHESVIFAGELFPPCKRCGHQVRFELVAAIEDTAFWPAASVPSVLVVGKEPERVRPVSALLRNSGYAVSLAETGIQARQCLHDRSFDVVITTTDVKDTTALDLAAAAKRSRPSPIIVVLAEAPTAEVMRAMLRIPVDYCALAPFTPEEIHTAVSRQLAFREASQPPALY